MAAARAASWFSGASSAEDVATADALIKWDGISEDSLRNLKTQFQAGWVSDGLDSAMSPVLFKQNFDERVGTRTNPIVLFLVGGSGQGKSFVCNSLTGLHACSPPLYKGSCSGQSQTAECFGIVSYNKHLDKWYLIVDCPGFADTKGNTIKYLDNIINVAKKLRPHSFVVVEADRSNAIIQHGLLAFSACTERAWSETSEVHLSNKVDSIKKFKRDFMPANSSDREVEHGYNLMLGSRKARYEELVKHKVEHQFPFPITEDPEEPNAFHKKCVMAILGFGEVVARTGSRIQPDNLDTFSVMMTWTTRMKNNSVSEVEASQATIRLKESQKANTETDIIAYGIVSTTADVSSAGTTVGGAAGAGIGFAVGTALGSPLFGVLVGAAIAVGATVGAGVLDAVSDEVTKAKQRCQERLRALDNDIAIATNDLKTNLIVEKQRLTKRLQKLEELASKMNEPVDLVESGRR